MAFWITLALNALDGIYNIGVALVTALVAPIALNIYNKIWLWTMK